MKRIIINGFLIFAIGVSANCMVSAYDGEIYPDSITASSTLMEEGYDHSPYKLTDWDYSTAWVEGAQDDGEGEFVDYFFPSGTVVTGISILPGYGKSEYAFYGNNAVSELRVQSGNASQTIGLWNISNDFSKCGSTTYFELEQPIVCDGTLRFTITDVRSGSKYNDTCMTELHVYGQKGNGTILKEADPGMLSGLAYRVYERMAGYNSPKDMTVSLDMLSDDDLAFLLYWYQYNCSASDSRIRDAGEYHVAYGDDLKEMLSALTGSSSDTLWDQFTTKYVDRISGNEYYMSATGDFGDAGPYYFTDATDDGIVDGNRNISGTVKVYNGQDKHFSATFTPINSPTLGGWQLAKLTVY